MGRRRPKQQGLCTFTVLNHLASLFLHCINVGTVLPWWFLQANCPLGGWVSACLMMSFLSDQGYSG